MTMEREKRKAAAASLAAPDEGRAAKRQKVRVGVVAVGDTGFERGGKHQLEGWPRLW